MSICWYHVAGQVNKLTTRDAAVSTCWHNTVLTCQHTDTMLFWHIRTIFNWIFFLTNVKWKILTGQLENTIMSIWQKPYIRVPPYWTLQRGSPCLRLPSCANDGTQRHPEMEHAPSICIAPARTMFSILSISYVLRRISSMLTSQISHNNQQESRKHYVVFLWFYKIFLLSIQWSLIIIFIQYTVTKYNKIKLQFCKRNMLMN